MTMVRHAAFTGFWFVAGISTFVILLCQLALFGSPEFNQDRALLALIASGVADLCFFKRLEEWYKAWEQDKTFAADKTQAGDMAPTAAVAEPPGTPG
jgi:hypothetical protein